ncbi:hypothetical protein ACFWMX_11305 [Streptomyces sp. NPDC058378]|uniref:hypothetical protein n=1 Tax=Streptomyces sp. NPDC058378 TaxID=3346469 RepID=UPI00365939F4
MSECDDRSVPQAPPAPRPEPLPAAEYTEAAPVYGRIVTGTAGPAPTAVEPETEDDDEVKAPAASRPEPRPEVVEAATARIHAVRAEDPVADGDAPGAPSMAELPADKGPRR